VRRLRLRRDVTARKLKENAEFGGLERSEKKNKDEH
jgi:hypothetical protein